MFSQQWDDIDNWYPSRLKTRTQSSCWSNARGQGINSPGPWFNIKMSSYQYRKSHCGDKTVVRSSYLHNGISYTDKMSSLYWIRALVLPEYSCFSNKRVKQGNFINACNILGNWKQFKWTWQVYAQRTLPEFKQIFWHNYVIFLMTTISQREIK